VDVILNNWDRIPTFWKNDGNIGNFMITDDNRIFAIDQTISTVIKDPNDIHFKNMASFLDNFLISDTITTNTNEDCLDSVLEDDPTFKFTYGDSVGMLNSPLHRVRAFFFNGTGCDIGTKGVHLFKLGFQRMAKHIVKTITLAHVQQLYRKSYQAVCEGFSEVAPDAIFEVEATQFVMKGIEMFTKKLEEKRA